MQTHRRHPQTPACPRGRAAHPGGRCPAPRMRRWSRRPCAHRRWRRKRPPLPCGRSRPASWRWRQRCLPAEYPRPRWRSQCGWPLRPPAFPAQRARASARAADRVPAAGCPCRRPEKQTACGQKLHESAYASPLSVWCETGRAALAERAGLLQMAGRTACAGAGHGMVGNA